MTGRSNEAMERSGARDVYPPLIAELLDVTLALAVAAGFLDIQAMTPKALLDEILRLPADDRLRLVEEIWDSLASSPDQVAVPEWHRGVLDKRLAEPKPDYLTWEQCADR